MDYSNIVDLNEFRKQKMMISSDDSFIKSEKFDCLEQDVELLISDLSHMIEVYEQNFNTGN